MGIPPFITKGRPNRAPKKRARPPPFHHIGRCKQPLLRHSDRADPFVRIGPLLKVERVVDQVRSDLYADGAKKAAKGEEPIDSPVVVGGKRRPHHDRDQSGGQRFWPGGHHPHFYHGSLGNLEKSGFLFSRKAFFPSCASSVM